MENWLEYASLATPLMHYEACDALTYSGPGNQTSTIIQPEIDITESKSITGTASGLTMNSSKLLSN
jgi:hypothetical protein